MNSIDSEDRLQNILKYGKYLVILIFLLVIFLLLKSCNRTYTDVENEIIDATKKYINKNDISITSETYIELTKLEQVSGTELCSQASGVIVKNENGNLKYQAYLDCLDYKSSFNRKTKYITLKGDTITILNEGEIFEDPMYTLKKEADVVVSGKASTKPGIYTISYMAYIGSSLKETVYRKVIVTKNDKDANISGLVNTQEPVITLMGEKNIVLAIGSKYKEAGYLAYDYEDGKITRQVKVDPNPEKIPTNSPGTYTITYSVTNSKGKKDVKARTITIVKIKSDLQLELSLIDDSISNKAIIKGTVIGEGLNYIELPDGNKEYEEEFTYKVTKNDIYTFKVYDYNDNGKGGFNETIKEIEVTNIDNVAPMGVCTALVRGNNTEIEVLASDNKGIAGYSYNLDGIESGYKNESTYKVASASKLISVNIKDIANNVTPIKCDVTIKNETTTSGRTDTGSATVIDTSDYTLVATRNDVIDFAKAVLNQKITQLSDRSKYGDSCLAFAYYHAYRLYSGEPYNALSAAIANDYTYASKFKVFNNDNKQEVLAKVYESITAGQPCVLHVNGNKAGTSRHFVTVVGYKNTVTSADTITDSDLLIIDSWDGYLERMDTTSSRFMISGHDTGRTGSEAYGYRVYTLK